MDTLEFVTEKINTKSNAPEVAGNPRGEVKPLKVDWNSPNDMKANWDTYIQNTQNSNKDRS